LCEWFQAIEEFKKGKVEYRVDKSGIVHIPFGKVDFPEEDLIANFMAVVVRSMFLQNIYLCSSFY
jgi:large subunit ribosomal protein L1